MAYAEVADVRNILVRDDDDTQGNAASLSDTKIEAAIVDAQTEVDGWLAVRYPVPYADGEVPALVRTLTIDIAAYLSDLTYRQASDFSSELDPVYLRYKRATTLLEKLADGTIELPPGGGDTPEPAPTDTAAFTMNAYTGTLFMPGDFDLRSDYNEDKRYGYFGERC